jgi:phosphoribosyl 1,2-cyclic phosphodiesterase
LKIQTLASSSSGNSAVLFTNKTKILIDVGLSRKRISERLSSISISLEELDAIFITHAHSDHVKGLPVLIKNCDCPVYCTRKTYYAMLNKGNAYLILGKYEQRFRFLEQESIIINELQISAQKFPHGGWGQGDDNVGEHVGFVVENDQKYKIGYATDLGHFPESVDKKFYNCDMYILESNHDIERQKKSYRPMGLIKRNLSDTGHLSNEQAADALIKLLSVGSGECKTKRVMLAHLSKDCNDHRLAVNVVRKKLVDEGYGKVEVIAAPYDVPSVAI